MQIIFTLEEVHKLCVYDRLQDIKFSVIHFDDTITKQKIQNMINTNHIVCLNDSEGLVKKADDVAQYIKELL